MFDVQRHLKDQKLAYKSSIVAYVLLPFCNMQVPDLQNMEFEMGYNRKVASRKSTKVQCIQERALIDIILMSLILFSFIRVVERDGHTDSWVSIDLN